MKPLHDFYVWNVRFVREGFGTHVIERIIREQLKGEMRLEWRAEGLACKIILQRDR